MPRSVGRWWHWIRRRPLLVTLVVAAFVVLLLVLYVLPAVLVGPDDKLTVAERLKSENDVRTTLLQALVGATLLVGLYFTGRTFQLNREGQATERFTRAIDQLGSDKLDVRIGGIYALERLAQASRVDHRAIMEVLATFVREHAPRRGDGNGQSPPEKAAAGDARPPGDVQAVLNVLKRRRRDWDVQPIDLRETDLRGADLHGAPLAWVNLRSAQLEHADLQYADLDHADLKEADLTSANLHGAILTSADLWNARLDGTFVNFTSFEDANLIGTSFAGTAFQNSNLRSVMLGMNTFAGTYLNGSDLQGTELSIGQLEFARVDEKTTLPLLESEGRIWASKGVRGWFIVVQEPGALPPTKAAFPEFDEEIHYDSEFEDVTERFVPEDQAY